LIYRNNGYRYHIVCCFAASLDVMCSMSFHYSIRLGLVSFYCFCFGMERNGAERNKSDRNETEAIVTVYVIGLLGSRFPWASRLAETDYSGLTINESSSLLLNLLQASTPADRRPGLGVTAGADSSRVRTDRLYTRAVRELFPPQSGLFEARADARRSL